MTTAIKEKNLSGLRFGRWLVLGDYVTTPTGRRKWLCQCDCGTQRYVLERSLVYGSSTSCGCLRIERANRANSQDLTGQKFGQLTVLYRADTPPGKIGRYWLCRCDCGREYTVQATLLITGRRTHCGSNKHEKHYAFADITGQKFGMLTALYPTEKRTAKGSIIWHCRCDCGNETDISYNELLYSSVISCGCRKKAHDKNLHTLLTRVDGTSIDKIKSKKLPSGNTTGYKGVYFIRGKYVAKIVFQKKAYYLGRFDNIEDAARARKQGEELLFDSAAEFYGKWKQKAADNPSWAQENPMKISVEKTHDGKLKISFLPDLN